MARSTAIADARRATVERTKEFSQELDQYAPNIAQALPAHVSIDLFKRVLITAVSMNPDLLYADRRTLYTSSVKCAADGLLPDGRDASLVVYNTEIKLRNPNTGLDEKIRINAVQYLPMVAGIKRRMRNSGEVIGVEAEVVYRNDRFRYVLGDNGFIEHEPPSLGEDRGDIVGAYARITLRSGYVIRDVMDKKRIEQARAQSRQKDGLMWTKFYDEGCKKTVLKHASKDAPQSSELERLLARDDEPPLIDEFTSLPGELTNSPAAPEPPRPLVEYDNTEPEPGNTFEIVDLDGNVFEFSTPALAMTGLGRLFKDAAKLGPDRLAGVLETNKPTIDAFEGEFGWRELSDDYAALMAAAKRAAEPPPQGSAHPLTINPPMRSGKIDWRTWALALFIQKVRRANDSTELAFLLGDNDENLKTARAALSIADRRELDGAIEQKWRELG